MKKQRIKRWREEKRVNHSYNRKNREVSELIWMLRLENWEDYQGFGCSGRRRRSGWRRLGDEMLEEFRARRGEEEKSVARPER